ncbi:MAG: hypothetical protein MUF23_17600 [Pirellula sp.]|nr:hypothetical protein [Pirellula sp.]
MATPKFVKHEKVSLRQHPTLSEKWLQDIIAADPSVSLRRAGDVSPLFPASSTLVPSLVAAARLRPVQETVG